jgi:uncharacterized protein (DUF2141 family)
MLRTLGFVALLAAGPALAADLKVEIRNPNADKGSIRVGLFDDPAHFVATPAQGVMISAAQRPLVAVFHDLKPGTYAISAFQDETGSGVLTKNLLGVPTERYGFSRDATGRLGPPSFEAASFVVGAQDQTVVVNLR